ALRDAAVDLPLNDERVDLLAAIVDGDVTKNLHVAGLFVHFDYADVRSVGEGEVLRLEEVCRDQPRLEIRRDVVRDVGAERHFLNRDASVVRRADESTLLEGQTGLAGSEQVRGERPRLGDHFLRGAGQRGPAHGDPAAAEGADAVLHDRGVAVDD